MAVYCDVRNLPRYLLLFPIRVSGQCRVMDGIMQKRDVLCLFFLFLYLGCVDAKGHLYQIECAGGLQI